MMMMMMISHTGRNRDVLHIHCISLYFWSVPGTRRQHPWADDALAFLYFFGHRSRSEFQRSLWIESTSTRPSGSWCCCSSTCQGPRIFGRVDVTAFKNIRFLMRKTSMEYECDDCEVLWHLSWFGLFCFARSWNMWKEKWKWRHGYTAVNQSWSSLKHQLILASRRVQCHDLSF